MFSKKKYTSDRLQIASSELLEPPLKAIAKRYVFGYVALAICVYQFIECINDIAKVCAVDYSQAKMVLENSATPLSA